MPWVRLDDGFADHPKIKKAGPLAIVAQVRALCYCARYLTNGKIPAKVVAEIFSDLAPLTPRVMLRFKIWRKKNQNYQIHDYLHYQPDRVSVLQLREKKVQAGRQGGLAKAIADARYRAKAPAMPPTRPQPDPKKKNSDDVSRLEIERQEQELHAKRLAALDYLKSAGLTPPAEVLTTDPDTP